MLIRISRVPDQVIRFYRLPGVANPHPLLVSNQPLATVEHCSRCGSHRELEFQVISTLLSFLNDDQAQFDSLLVYTCPANCDLATGGGWVEEVVIEQSYSQEGVQFGSDSKE